MVAAENGALPGGKVGGVADVVRDLPVALADAGWKPVVLTPEYGLFGKLPGATLAGRLDVPFGGERRRVEVLELPGPDERVRHVAFRSPDFHPQGPGIYCDDGHARPFASDATKFALLSATAARYVQELDVPPAVVHLHDWHAAMYLALRAFDPAFSDLGKIRTVFTIHNLALQGIRPLAGDPSSLAAWFPKLDAGAAILDPRFRDCVNPMATAIRLADAVNTVSPTYAKEIVRPNDPGAGFRGGEGLEGELAGAAAEGRLVGILNGCEYPKRDRRRPGWRRLVDTVSQEVFDWIVQHRGPHWIHELTLEHLRALPKRRPKHLLTSIGRLTEQKASLFLERTGEGARAVEKILGSHARDTVLMVLGSGNPDYESAFADIAIHHPNFVFVCGYSEALPDLLYRTGDLFLMPSSFEPCGISQMLAMRAAQPVLAHAVGGLRDTVENGVNGFTFDGRSVVEQAEHFVDGVSRAIAIRNDDQEYWLKIRNAAEAARFPWSSSAEQYINSLYCGRSPK